MSYATTLPPRPIEQGRGLLWHIAGRKLDQLNRVILLEELRLPPGNHPKALSGNREGQHSIRINDQYRICFRWADDDAHDVEITDYH